MPAVESTVTVPSSFSSMQKQNSIRASVESILKMLQYFEVDSHVDVVLLGSSFSQSFVRDVTSYLSHLSRMGYVGSSLEYVHEKFVFHVGMSRQLESSLLLDIEGGAQLNDDSLSSHFKRHHYKATTGTTIFILNFPTYDMMISDTFISPEGFAWLDVTPSKKNYGYVSPISPMTSVMPNPFHGIERELSSHDLAVLIYRSAEQLSPPVSPVIHSQMNITDSDSGDWKIRSELPTTNVNVRLLTLCGYPLARCQPDMISAAAISAVSEHVGGGRIQVSHQSSMVRLTDSPSVTHALLSALQRHTPPPEGTGKGIHRQPQSEKGVWGGRSLLSPSEMMKRLFRSDELQAVLAHSLEQEGRGRVLPVVSVLLPAEWDVVLSMEGTNGCGAISPLSDGRQVGMTACTRFDHLSSSTESGWKLHREAVVVLRRDDTPTPDRSHTRGQGSNRAPPLDTGLIQIDGKEVPRSDAFETHELSDAIMATLWGIPPAHSYYSASAQQMVSDFLWYPALALRSKESLDNFRYSRVVRRHMLLLSADDAIRRTAVALAEAEGFSVGIPFLEQRFQLTGVVQDSSATSTIVRPSAVQDIIHGLDGVATDYSHLEFDLALQGMTDVDAKVQQLESLVQKAWVGSDPSQLSIECKSYDQYSFNIRNTVTESNGVFLIVVLVIGTFLGMLGALYCVGIKKYGTIGIRRVGRRVVVR
mmetsp:Transcript_2267/g.3480  ORF Transcript_2267/g.3480 Transcript_2267/m.3480 type:complete len:701 (+) Transcript_2267:114-2216(+)